MYEFRICPVILQQDANPTFDHVGNPHLMTLFLWFYNRMRISHFYNPFLLQLASMCDLTICWGHAGRAAKPENPESPVFVPSPQGTCLQPRTYR